jgi:hypothetical protein
VSGDADADHPLHVVPATRFAPARYGVAPIYRPAPAFVPAPVYGPAPVYREPDFVDPPAYDFSYGVHTNDYHGASNFGHTENRVGYTTNGEYRVDLPDGRTQVVTYTVGDATSGYVADVRYEGQAVPYVAPRPVYGVPTYGRILA